MTFIAVSLKFKFAPEQTTEIQALSNIGVELDRTISVKNNTYTLYLFYQSVKETPSSLKLSFNNTQN